MKTLYFRLLTFILCISLAACSRDEVQPEPALVGQWTDYNVVYTFNNDLTYAMNYLRNGRGGDTITVDSVFGIYRTDSKRKSLSFEIRGYRTKEGQLINKSLSGTTWQYNIQDNKLNYQSRTIIGTLFKKE
jgi:hypothetical protein